MDEIEINGVIGSWEVDPQEIITQLNNASGDIIIKIDSIGGSVIGGFSIFNAIKAYNKGSVKVEVNAVAASIASYIALAGDKLTVHSNSVFMIHNAWLPAVGDFRALRKAADISEGLSSIIAQAYISKTKMKELEIRQLMDEESFFYGDEILNKGFADEIITLDGTTTKAQAMALALENLKACNNAVYEHSKDIDFEAVAKLIPKKEEKEETIVADMSAKKRKIELEILEREVMI